MIMVYLLVLFLVSLHILRARRRSVLLLKRLAVLPYHPLKADRENCRVRPIAVGVPAFRAGGVGRCGVSVPWWR